MLVFLAWLASRFSSLILEPFSTSVGMLSAEKLQGIFIPLNPLLASSSLSCVNLQSSPYIFWKSKPRRLEKTAMGSQAVPAFEREHSHSRRKGSWAPHGENMGLGELGLVWKEYTHGCFLWECLPYPHWKLTLVNTSQFLGGESRMLFPSRRKFLSEIRLWVFSFHACFTQPKLQTF